MAGPAPRIHLSRASSSGSDDAHYRHPGRGDGAATEADLWAALTPHHLLLLRQQFAPPRGWTGRASLAGREDEPGMTHYLNRSQFVDAVSSLLGSHKFEGVCGAIFDAVVAAGSSASPSLVSSGVGAAANISSSSSSNLSSTSSSTGSSAGMSWSGLVSYLAAGVGGGGPHTPTRPLLSSTPRYRLLTHNKREGVAGVVACGGGGGGLLVVGARGSLTKVTHSTKWHQQQHSRLHLDSSPDDSLQPLATRKVGLGTWVVEVAVMEEEVAVVAASSSTLHMVEAASGAAQELLRLTHLPAMPACLAAGCVGEERWVAVGDERGSVHLIRFPHPVSELLTRSRSEGLTSLTWQEVCGRVQEVNGRLVEVCRRVKVVSAAGVHGASVRRVQYHPPTSSLVSCSTDPRTSVVLWGPDHATKTYTFAIPRGVRVMAVEWSLHVLVTGSMDGRLRVWNPYVPEAALALLPPAPGRAPPTDLLVCSRRRAIIACDADAVVRVYDVESWRCLQTLSLSFPGGSCGLAPRPLTLLHSGHLLVACRDYLAFISPALSPHSAQYTSSAFLPQLVSDPCWEGESEEGDGERDEDDDSNKKDEENQLFEDAVLMSSDERRQRAQMRSLVRQGAAFCCLNLNEIPPPRLSSDLPLPPRLVALGLTASNPVALLPHLPVSKVTTAITTVSPPSSAATRRLTPTPRSSRPQSSRPLARSKSPGGESRLTTKPDNSRSKRHLSPGWRPQPANQA
ncbi:uncharacterized protein [Procambarus clarkii]|uniref:uncharacterized protein n=1 Tax=Procambarus clarkii TaxID=6728 RepID=UPI001E6711A0|nr:uncharacterized protein LOC123773482 [Procambarus clarkii]